MPEMRLLSEVWVRGGENAGLFTCFWAVLGLTRIPLEKRLEETECAVELLFREGQCEVSRECLDLSLYTT